MSNSIDKSKLVEWLQKEIVTTPDYEIGDIAKLEEVLSKINSGDLDEDEAVGSEWKPTSKEDHTHYFTPEYDFSGWSVREEPLKVGSIDDQVINKQECFETESDCKRYMNAKGWINEKEWEV